MARLDKERFFLIKTARCVRFQSWANTKLPFPMSISVVRAVTPVQESQWRRGEMQPKSSLGTWGWNSQEAARRRPERTGKVGIIPDPPNEQDEISFTFEPIVSQRPRWFEDNAMILLRP